MPGFAINGLNTENSNLVSTRQDIYLSYCWEIPIVIGEYGIKTDSSGTGDSALLMLKDATLPTFTVVKDSYLAGSLEYKYAKSVVWDDIKVTWYDTLNMIKIMDKWRASVWSASEGLKAASSYKKNTVMKYFLPDGSGINSYTLQGSWPSQIRSGDLTYTSTEAKIVEVTLSYDWATEDWVRTSDT